MRNSAEIETTIFFSPPVQKQLLSSPFVLLPPLNSLFIAFAASLFRLNTFFKLTRQMDFLNGACHESISPKKLMCPMGSGHALHDALLYSVCWEGKDILKPW